jgi:acid phosphatase family membrane protein YuiD
MNRGIYTALITILFAQTLKIPIRLWETGKVDWKAILDTGGMPSSHSAGVSSLSTFIAWKRGIRSLTFALSAIFGIIVMFDAQGVRRQSGELTIMVNQLEEQIERLNDEVDHHYHDYKNKRLKEKLGHQPIEVIGGALLGMVTGSLGYFCSRRK